MPSPHAIAALAFVQAECSILGRIKHGVTNFGSLPHLLQRSGSGLWTAAAQVGFKCNEHLIFGSRGPNEHPRNLAVSRGGCENIDLNPTKR